MFLGNSSLLIGYCSLFLRQPLLQLGYKALRFRFRLGRCPRETFLFGVNPLCLGRTGLEQGLPLSYGCCGLALDRQRLVFLGRLLLVEGK